MQGSVYVPYTGIGGMNMDSGIMPADLRGSTEPGVMENQEGTTVNLMWNFPGGIQNGHSTDKDWGYALIPGKYCSDEDIKQWLQGNVPEARTQPTQVFTVEEIEEAVNPAIAEEINNLMKDYLIKVMDTGDYTDFRDGYPGCVVRGGR